MSTALTKFSGTRYRRVRARTYFRLKYDPAAYVAFLVGRGQGFIWGFGTATAWWVLVILWWY